MSDNEEYKVFIKLLTSNVESNTVYQPTTSADHEEDDDFIEEEVTKSFEQGSRVRMATRFNTVSK